MYVKKIFLFFVTLFLLGGSLFSNEFAVEDLNGVWLTPKDLNSCLKSSWSRLDVSFFLGYTYFIVHWNNATKEGFFQTGPERNVIRTIEITGKRVTIKYPRIEFPNREIVLEYISRDLFRVISSVYNGDPNLDYLFRISDFAKKTQAKGRINDYGVRFRNKPELTSDVWLHFDFGEEVDILDISAEKQTIGELEAYWYEVRLNYPDTLGDGSLDGWVFGAYLDVENRAELEEKLKKLRRDGG